MYNKTVQYQIRKYVPTYNSKYKGKTTMKLFWH